MKRGFRGLFHRSKIDPVLDSDTRPVVLDFVPGAETLVIALAGYGGDVGVPRFEFRGALSEFNCSTAFVRQVNPVWYHGPIEGVGEGLDGLAEWVVEMKAEAAATRVVLVGSSMGGYGAIYAGWKASVDHVLAFAPQTYLGPLRRTASLDARWMAGVRATWQAAWPQTWRALDLLHAAPQSTRVAVDVYVPSHHRLDRQHALRLVGVPGVTVHLRPSVDHMIVKEMRDCGDLARVLRRVVGSSSDK